MKRYFFMTLTDFSRAVRYALERGAFHAAPMFYFKGYEIKLTETQTDPELFALLLEHIDNEAEKMRAAAEDPGEEPDED